MAEERIRKIQEEQNKLQKKKDQQKEFYIKFLKKTNEVNKQRLEVKQQQEFQQKIQEIIEPSTDSNKFQSRIPLPKFARDLPQQRQPFQKSKDKELINNLNGLDLELSQTKRLFKPINKQQSPEPVRKLISRGDLIDSLDLNVGYESIQKLKENWGLAFQQHKKPE